MPPGTIRSDSEIQHFIDRLKAARWIKRGIFCADAHPTAVGDDVFRLKLSVDLIFIDPELRQALHDLGLASAHLTFEATSRGISVHQMAGIVPDKARAVYHIPEGVQPLTGLAIGYAADPQSLPDALKDRDLAARTRKRLAEFVFAKKWGDASPVVST